MSEGTRSAFPALHSSFQHLNIGYVGDGSDGERRLVGRICSPIRQMPAAIIKSNGLSNAGLYGKDVWVSVYNVDSITHGRFD